MGSVWKGLFHSSIQCSTHPTGTTCSPCCLVKGTEASAITPPDKRAAFGLKLWRVRIFRTQSYAPLYHFVLFVLHVCVNRKRKHYINAGVCEVIHKCLSVRVCGGHTKLCILLLCFALTFSVTNLSTPGCDFNWQPRQIYDQQPPWPWCPAFCQFCCFLFCLSVLSCQVCPATARLQKDINKCCATQANTLNGRLRRKFFFLFLVNGEQNFWTFEWTG